MKECFKCKETKQLTEFYKHKGMADGHLNKCKDCARTDSLKTRENNIDYYREYDRKRSDLPHRIEIRKNIAKKWATDPVLKKRANKLKKQWAEKNTIKRAAHIITGHAIKSGKLIKQPCEVCGIKKVDAHHDDYSKPLDVRWLCRVHHAEHHKNIRDKQRQKD